MVLSHESKERTTFQTEVERGNLGENEGSSQQLYRFRDFTESLWIYEAFPGLISDPKLREQPLKCERTRAFLMGKSESSRSAHTPHMTADKSVPCLLVQSDLVAERQGKLQNRKEQIVSAR